MKAHEHGIRLQKYLAERGVASRRGAAELIASGRVQVNGVIVTEPGFRVSSSETSVTCDGRHVMPEPAGHRTLLLYKPRGTICSASSRHGRTVLDLLPTLTERLVPVGRLDKNSEGLLLLSNDGDLVNQLTHPRYGHRKIYHVTVSGQLTGRTLQRLQSRMLIDGHRIQPVEVRVLTRNEPGGAQAKRLPHVAPASCRCLPPVGRTRLEFILKEGRNRQIRKMCALVSLRVHRILRVAVGGLTLEGMKPGEWRDLTAEELNSLKA